MCWCLIRRAKSPEESAADSLLVVDEGSASSKGEGGVKGEGGGSKGVSKGGGVKGSGGGTKKGVEKDDEMVEDGVVCVDEWRLESEVLAWIERRENNVSSTTTAR